MPTVGARFEHMTRAKTLEGIGNIKMLSPDKLSPDTLGDMVEELMLDSNGLTMNGQTGDLSMDGLKVITDRVRALCGISDLQLQKAV